MGIKKQKGCYSVVALEKAKMFILKKDFYNDKDTLMKAIEGYRSNGYRVTYTTKEE
jgi:hypothetical protein